MADNVIFTLSKQFAIRMIKLYPILQDRKEFVISKQLYRSGTSIGANLADIYAQSNADYINKLKIALKEASETRYWIELLSETGYLDIQEANSLNNDIKTIIGTLVNIINKINRNETSF